MTHVIINDYPSHHRTDLFFTRDDMDEVEGVWSNEDQLLVDLQSNKYFVGRTRWSDLDPFHFRIMVTKNLQRVADLPEQERGNVSNPVVDSLHFLICGLIIVLEKRSDSSIEVLKLQRVGDFDVAVEYQSVLEMTAPTVATKPGISIVVDNSDQ